MNPAQPPKPAPACKACGWGDGTHAADCPTKAAGQERGARTRKARRAAERAAAKAAKKQQSARRRLKVGPMRSPLGLISQAELDANPVSPPYGFLRMFRSKALVVFECARPGGLTLLMVQKIDATDGITWDVLQWVKGELGYGQREAVELYPVDDQVVNVANMRHLWLLPEGQLMPFGLDSGRRFGGLQGLRTFPIVAEHSLAIEPCTDWTADHCPIHGGCTCEARDNSVDGDRDTDELGDPDCPLHGMKTGHADWWPLGATPEATVKESLTVQECWQEPDPAVGGSLECCECGGSFPEHAEWCGIAHDPSGFAPGGVQDRNGGPGPRPTDDEAAGSRLEDL